MVPPILDSSSLFLVMIVVGLDDRSMIGAENKSDEMEDA
jgi:hypothetical protein